MRRELRRGRIPPWSMGVPCVALSLMGPLFRLIDECSPPTYHRVQGRCPLTANRTLIAGALPGASVLLASKIGVTLNALAQLLRVGRTIDGVKGSLCRRRTEMKADKLVIVNKTNTVVRHIEDQKGNRRQFSAH
jgi:hypothetical protein